MNTSENLTLQQQRFCDEYLVSFNAHRAALNAGYSDNTARKGELLHLPGVQAYLKAAMNKTANRLQVTHDMILRELAKIAFSNMGNYYDETGAIKPMYAISDDDKAALSLYQIMDTVNEHGERIGELSRIKLHNKLSALDKIARHVGFYGANGGRKTEGGRLMTESGVLNEEVADTDLSEQFEEVVNFEPEAVNQEVLVMTPETVESEVEVIMDVAPATAENILTLSPLAEAPEVVNRAVKNEGSSYQPPMRIFENRNKNEKKRATGSSRGEYTFRKAGGE